jgi:GNAT superfamily N-acetyltransferase
METVVANYFDPKHEAEIQNLLDSYASDPMGGGKPLKREVKREIVKELGKIPHAFSILAYDQGIAVGLANCFESFSTFACKPIINIHDFMVVEHYRGRGVSQPILKKIEEVARLRGCCKVTLEVLSNNRAARASYKKFGFSGYELDPNHGQALFWHKQLL